MKTYKEILVESSLSRVYQHTQDRNLGSITANRAIEKDETPEHHKARNLAANMELQKSIEDAGHGYVHVRGRYIQNHGTPEASIEDEHSYLVIGKKGDDKGEMRDFLTKHGEKHNQDSVLYKPHNEKNAQLIGTNNAEWHGKGNVEQLGGFKANTKPMFHSVLFGRESKAPEDLAKGHTKGSGPRSFAFESFEVINIDCFFLT